MVDCSVPKSCRAPSWPLTTHVDLHSLGTLASYVVRSGLVAEGHHGYLVVVDVQRPVQPVRIVVFNPDNHNTISYL